MKIRILGAGFYGCHIAKELRADGHEVEVWEIEDRIFANASGGIPARLHIGAHYPRSRATRAACLDHNSEFMQRYGFLTRPVPVNIYAIAAERSMVDFEQYTRTLRNEIEFLTLHDPGEFGLTNVEGAIQIAERHIVVDRARQHFEESIGDLVRFDRYAEQVDDARWNWTIDCTFCANDSAGVDRYEPCIVLLLEAPTNKAVTIMDGPFPSLYPWNEEAGLCSLSSALWTPLSKNCPTRRHAVALFDEQSEAELQERAARMIDSMAEFYPRVRDYPMRGYMLSIRAMPLSGADTRLVDVRRVGERALRVRAGKIDAVIVAAQEIRRILT